MEKTIDLIRERIRDGNARVVTAEEMPVIVEELGEEGALREVDVVTTGTFGAMCSSGAFLNFGHADPPIKMERVWLNDVEAYGGIAAVDAYIGATQKSTTREEYYGGAHVIEDFVSGKTVELRALSTGTDCYPRRTITTEILLENLNEATMVNPRNGYQRYNAATNSTDRTLSTYMGMLLPNCGNISFSGSGLLNPITNDPAFRVIGSGVPAFLCGAPGMIVGEGTQHSPAGGFGTLMVTADMKRMSPDFLRAATMTGYGVTLYVGLGIPLPVLDLDMVRSTAVRDEDIIVDIIDYGIPSRDRPSLRKVSYAELKSGGIELNGEEVRTSPLSSYRRAREVALTLKSWVEEGKLDLALPTRKIDATRKAHPLRETVQGPRVLDIMDRKVFSIGQDEEIRSAAQKLLKGETNHLPVIDSSGRLVGIVTTYDISKAVVNPGKAKRVRDIMKKRVITTTMEEPVDIAVRKLEKHNISALPVVDREERVIGMLTAMNLGKLFGGRWLK
ncbi:MAG TPA: homocysteine biosynthesis protein [Methanoregulaceae archaeon]|nr:MAG: homocysteine biosynthesis protein [Methanolinea sp.]HON81096.1 homocysteine biosynthesis protein [Methanoregulaceae archaeon]HPD09960.1 homocysteine biosynthesis protein [Methanoregulaceae archaeon]HRT14849.1 homocysteine biosynthesis protein [Methanoregulaceae archaeon]HRU30536.1 homocysteine biosynthesis protein [Methanoregulaceae archaeon]